MSVYQLDCLAVLLGIAGLVACGCWIERGPR